MTNLVVVILLILLVFLVTKKLKFSKPIPFALLMGLVFIFILWGIN